MVIQRWQSVMLLIAGALMACFTFFSLGQWQCQDYTLNFTTIGFTYEGIPTGGAQGGYFLHTWYLFGLSLASALLPLVDIFLFRNLKLQRRLCAVEVMLIAVVCAVAGGLGYAAFPFQSMGWSSWILAPLVALVAVMVAYTLIGRDHKLLKSVDRLR